MLFVLAGPSYVGKKTAMAYFMKLYSFSSIIPYTTKPIESSNGEVDGIKYHYVLEDDRSDIENDKFIHDTPFKYGSQNDTVLYAYKKSDIETAIEGYANFIIHASVGNAMNIYDEYHNSHEGQLYVIFLDYNKRVKEEFFKNKYKQELILIHGSEDVTIDSKDFNRRFIHAKKEQSVYSNNKEKFDFCIKADHKYEICEKLEKTILPKLRVMPTLPDRIPGPLSDVDIKYMCENRKSDSLQVQIGTKKIEGEGLKTMLSGCGMQLTMSPTIRKVKKSMFSNYIDMARDESGLEVQLSRLYPEENIATGYILNPHEVILCSTEEKLTMPHDVYAIVSSKFSYTQLGLSIELGTSIIQAGHIGRVHFQVKNNTENSICIYPHIQVLQLLFFRTVQPTSKKYRDDENAHAYDDESVPPISKFRVNNEPLTNVHRPTKKFFGKVWDALQTEIIAKIIGAIFFVLLVLYNASKLEDLLVTHVLPRIINSPMVMQCLIIAFAGCLLGSIFKIVGILIVNIIIRIISFVRNQIR